ncbi:DUF1569 domain-containing protein [Flavobacterium caeni]|uniref:DUF1569 domain-containing protein n=1 Tax=Flavobacterium caeni TaxID=490189 RepID=A0A1G5DX18_9FLAO|nr:DUF1569 domain-containing protein [Flavobacterium caeni]SCY19284.1 Protein of unknown function [Flavobacterium caeni]
MKTDIFDLQANQSLQDRLQQLTAQTTPLWGKMDAAQMVLHCQKPLDVADGKLMLNRSLIGFLFGRMAKESFLKKDEFKKNLPTAPQFKITHHPDFEKEKQVLADSIKKFGTVGPKVIINKKHPFFGTMNDQEWGILQYKHLDHHLKQFGL